MKLNDIVIVGIALLVIIYVGGNLESLFAVYVRHDNYWVGSGDYIWFVVDELGEVVDSVHLDVTGFPTDKYEQIVCPAWGADGKIMGKYFSCSQWCSGEYGSSLCAVDCAIAGGWRECCCIYQGNLYPKDFTISVAGTQVLNYVGELTGTTQTDDFSDAVNTYCNYGDFVAECAVPMQIVSSYKQGRVELVTVGKSSICIDPVTTEPLGYDCGADTDPIDDGIIVNYTCVSNEDCYWCGDVCKAKEDGDVCIMIAPPVGVECVCANDECTTLAPKPEPKNPIEAFFDALKNAWDSFWNWISNLFK